MSTKTLSDTLWSVPLVLVGLVVLLGVLRLVLSNWSYVFLVAVVVIGGYYIRQGLLAERK
jgi:hypothetical protein